jgi:hypothetical protein
MHRAHTADTRPATIFIHNDAPQALLDCQAGGSAISTFSAALMPQGARRRRWPTQIPWGWIAAGALPE